MRRATAAQARCQLRHVHRLRQHVVGSGVDQLDRLGGVAERLQHQHGHADAADGAAASMKRTTSILLWGTVMTDRFAALGRRFDEIFQSRNRPHRRQRRSE
jgi:hypothetical protein